MTSLSTNLKLGLALILVGLLAMAAITLNGWRVDSDAYVQLVPEHAALLAERDALNARVLALTSDNATLRLVVAEQNHAVEVAKLKTAAAEAAQQTAKAFAARLSEQTSKRIQALESDLADAAKTITDLLDADWRRYAH